MTRSLSEAATYVLGQFDTFGLEVPAESRFRRMYSVLCNDDGSSRGLIPEAAPDFEIAIEGLRDFSQMEFFFDQIHGDSRTEEYRRVLARVVSDSVRPQDDRESSPGRDAQAELFMFAVCKKGGMSPLFAEPDITCESSGTRFGVAVKRIKNLSKLLERLRDGVEQISRSARPGIISAEISLALNPENHAIMTNMPESAVRRWWEDKMRALVDQYNEFRDEYVRGIFLHEHCPVRLDGSYVLRTMNYAIGTASTAHGQMEWDGLRRAIFQGLPNLVA